MTNTARVDKNLFTGEHYLGKPADDDDKIISRRIEILENYPRFFGESLSCIEVGCGSGATLTRVANRFGKSLGIDIFDYASQFELVRMRNDAHNCSFRQVDLESENLGEQFDRLISFEVIEHLKNEESVEKYFQVLKEGGLAAITVPNKWWIFETHGAKLPLLPWNRVPFFSWLPTPLHERFANARIYTAGRVRRLLERHGFTVIDQCYITAPMDVLKEGWLKKLLIRFIFKSNTTGLPILSTSIFIMAKKRSAYASG